MADPLRWCILVAGTLGGGLYAFHLFQESGAERSLAGRLVFLTETDGPQAAERLLRHLALSPGWVRWCSRSWWP